MLNLRVSELGPNLKLKVIPKDKKKTKKKIHPLTVEVQKLISYRIFTKNKHKSSYRKLGDFFGRDHKTIKAWDEEVETWDRDKRDNAANHMITTMRTNKDLYEVSKYKRTSYHLLEKILSENGIATDGRKRRQKLT